MRAARFHARRDVRVEDVPAPPDRLGPTDVLVENALAGICGTDLHEYVDGPIFVPGEPHPYSGARLPLILGHEFGGRVVAVGSEVRDCKPGDRVAIQPHIAPPDDFYRRRGHTQLSRQLAIAGLSWPWGGFAEYAVVNDYNAVPIPDGVTDEQAALIEPAAVAVYATERAGIKPGDSVLVCGAGPIGQLQAMAARAAGASRIFLSDVNPNRLAFARGIVPGLVTLDARADDVVAAVRDSTQAGAGADVVVECSGSGPGLSAAIEAVRPRGVVVQLGLHGKPAAIDAFALTCKDVDLRGSWCYSTFMWPRVAGLMAAGLLPAEKIVTRTIGLDRIVADGFEALIDPAGTDIKVLVDVSR